MCEEIESKPIANYTLQKSMKSIIFHKNYLLALHKRLGLLRNGLALKSEYEKNEVEITTFQTELIINRTLSAVRQLESVYRTNLISFYKDLQELSENYKSVLEKALGQQSENIDIKHILYHTDWKYIKENAEEKIKLYKDLKRLLPE